MIALSCVFRRVHRLLDASGSKDVERFHLLDLNAFCPSKIKASALSIMQLQVSYFEPLSTVLGYGLCVALRECRLCI